MLVPFKQTHKLDLFCKTDCQHVDDTVCMAGEMIAQQTLANMAIKPNNANQIISQCSLNSSYNKVHRGPFALSPDTASQAPPAAGPGHRARTAGRASFQGVEGN
jgi:hypothetical protein